MAYHGFIVRVGFRVRVGFTVGFTVRVGFRVRVRVSVGDLWFTNKVDIQKRTTFLVNHCKSCPSVEKD